MGTQESPLGCLSSFLLCYKVLLCCIVLLCQICNRMCFAHIMSELSLFLFKNKLDFNRWLVSENTVMDS